MRPTTNQNPTVTIDRPQQLVELVDRCGNEGRPIVDYGLAHGGLGNPPPPQHVRLVLRGDVIEHHVQDLVVRAATGTTMGRLQAVLEQNNQFLPIDADEDLTLGEVILHNVYGPLRLAYGSARDILLGLRFVDGQARDIHVGGRTVKNVAGYDLTRLMVGSLGEMGCVYEATLRTSAVPEAVVEVRLAIDHLATVDRSMTNLLVSDAAPDHLSLQSQPTGSTAYLGYCGHPESCQARLDALEKFIEPVQGAAVQSSRIGTVQQDNQQRAGRRRWMRRTTALVKVLVPPVQTGATCNDMRQWITPPLTIDALPAHGCIFLGGQLDADACHELEQQIQKSITPAGGLWIWYARPPGAETIEPFGPPQPDWPILARVKKTLDPMGIFNPGRLLEVHNAPSTVP